MTSLAERLGYAPDAKLLIVNCDDLGSSRAANVAVYEALRSGLATSATLMVPCPWARDAAAMYRGEDVGVHLTLNSEWETYRWGPITHSPSLLDGDGGFPRTIEDVWDHADLDEVRKECRGADRAGDLLGLRRQPPRQPHGHAAAAARVLRRLPRAGGRLRAAAAHGRCVSPAADRLPVPRARRATKASCSPTTSFVRPIGARRALERVLFDLRPGVTEVYLHPAVDTDELRASHPDWAGRVEDHATCVATPRSRTWWIVRARSASATARSATCNAAAEASRVLEPVA